MVRAVKHCERLPGEAVELHPSLQALEAQQHIVLGNLLPLGMLVNGWSRGGIASGGGISGGGSTDKICGQQEGGKCSSRGDGVAETWSCMGTELHPAPLYQAWPHLGLHRNISWRTSPSGEVHPILKPCFRATHMPQHVICTRNLAEKNLKDFPTLNAMTRLWAGLWALLGEGPACPRYSAGAGSAGFSGSGNVSLGNFNSKTPKPLAPKSSSLENACSDLLKK